MQSKRKPLLAWTLFSLIVVGVIAFLLWWFYFRIEDYTDDAYVHGNMLELTAQVSGIVSSVNVNDTQFVLKDQILFELDPTDFEIRLRHEMANLGQQVRYVATLFDDVEERRADLLQSEAELIKAGQDYEHRAGVVGMGGVSVEDFEHSEAQLRSAEAQVIKDKAALEAAKALVENTTIRTHPLVIQAQQMVKEAYVNLRRTKIVCPVDGIIDQRTVQVGESINPTDPLCALIPLEQMWVNANYKETQLKRIRIGQPVKMHADMYGHSVIFNGIVEGLSAGTGAVFSVLPPQNATGNWIKIVQRLPVRIKLEAEELRRYPLRLGLSMKVTVDTKDEKGIVVPAASYALKPLYSTDIYAQQEAGALELINRVMQENMPNGRR
ncbi:MAG: HlyD family efflux transporter periplasmic adaptor subunit [Chlamydiales bacterium]|nr:HlyD family efflux transporter periplasmic adaptor subunit [Chlamydiales bacterium]